jgi:hypothetical protein
MASAVTAILLGLAVMALVVLIAERSIAAHRRPAPPKAPAKPAAKPPPKPAPKAPAKPPAERRATTADKRKT